MILSRCRFQFRREPRPVVHRARALLALWIAIVAVLQPVFAARLIESPPAHTAAHAARHVVLLAAPIGLAAQQPSEMAGADRSADGRTLLVGDAIASLISCTAVRARGYAVADGCDAAPRDWMSRSGGGPRAPPTLRR